MTGTAGQMIYGGGGSAALGSRTAQAERPRAAVRRRGSLVQGRALETLGHAVEYLQDARLFDLDPESAAADREAVQLLKRSSREVFAECPEIVSLGDRIGRWIATGWTARRVGRDRAA